MLYCPQKMPGSSPSKTLTHVKGWSIICCGGGHGQFWK